MEYDFFRVESFSLEPNSFGQGRFRGGAGFSKTFRVLKDDVTFAIYSDRFRYAPQGFLGGDQGSCGYCEVTRAGAVERIPSKSLIRLNAGDTVKMYMGGGGGYGKPAERLPARIEADRLDGLTQ